MERRAMLYFGNEMAREAFLDDDSRARQLEAGIKIVSGVDGVRIENRFPSVCAVSVSGTVVALQTLQHVLETTEAGKMNLANPERPAFRSAR